MKQITNWEDFKGVEFEGMYIVDVVSDLILFGKNDKLIISIDKKYTTIEEVVKLLKVYGFEIEYKKQEPYVKLVFSIICDEWGDYCWRVTDMMEKSPKSGRLLKGCSTHLGFGDIEIKISDIRK